MAGPRFCMGRMWFTQQCRCLLLLLAFMGWSGYLDWTFHENEKLFWWYGEYLTNPMTWWNLCPGLQQTSINLTRWWVRAWWFQSPQISFAQTVWSHGIHIWSCRATHLVMGFWNIIGSSNFPRIVYLEILFPTALVGLPILVCDLFDLGRISPMQRPPEKNSRHLLAQKPLNQKLQARPMCFTLY